MKNALKEGRSKGLSGKKKSGPPLKKEEPVLKRTANDDGKGLEESTERQTEEKQTGPSAEQLPTKDPAAVVEEETPPDKPSSDQHGPGTSETKKIEEEVQSHEDGPVREVKSEKVERGHAEIQEQPGPDEEKGRGVYSFPFSPEDVEGLTFDSTSHVKVSSMANEDFSREIIRDTMSQVDLDRIRARIKEGDRSRCLNEAETQIKALWQGALALEVHTDKYTVLFLRPIGDILNEIQPLFKKRSHFTKWIKDRFQGRHIRVLQHARQIAGMGAVAEKYASIGKNRILDFYRAQKYSGKSCEELVKEHPFADTADEDRAPFARHIDAIITFYRFKAEIPFIEFAQAQILVGFRQGAVEVGTVKKVREWLATREDQTLAFEEYVQDGGVLPKDVIAGGRKRSLGKILADLNQYESHTALDSIEEVDPDSLKRAYGAIKLIARKFQVDLDETDIEGGENDDAHELSQ
jgi:hypothetical protein